MVCEMCSSPSPMSTERRAKQDALEASAARIADELAGRAAAFELDEQVPREIFARLGEARLMQVNAPESLGGADAGTVGYARAMMQIARGCASTAVTMAVTNMVGEVIARFGTAKQSAHWCARLAKGELGAFGLSEVGAGSDPGGMRTVARQDGDDWILDGTKQWISHGDQSAVVVIWARTDGDGPRGLSCFLVPGDAPGLGVSKHEDKMGLRASHTVGLTLDAVRVPGVAMLGERGQGFAIAMMALDGGRIGIASQAVGIATSAYRSAVEACRARGERDQGVLFRLADMATELDAARLMALRAAHLKEDGEVFTQEASMAKAFATEAAWRICNTAVEVIGDDALERGHPAERALRDVRVTRIYEGTSEVQRIVISRAVLR